MNATKALLVTGALLLAGTLAATKAGATVYDTESTGPLVQNDWPNVSIGSGSSNVELVISGAVSIADSSTQAESTVSEEFSPGSEFTLDVGGIGNPTSAEKTYYNLPSGYYNINEIAYAAEGEWAEDEVQFTW